jgi:hypothetical protein
MRKNSNVASLNLPGTWYYWFASAQPGISPVWQRYALRISTVKLGDLGTSNSWPLLMASIVIVSSVSGSSDRRMAEYRQAADQDHDHRRVSLVVAMAILGYASSL